MKKLTSLLIVGLCLAVSGLADVVDNPQAGDKKPQAGQAGDKALKKPPLLRKKTNALAEGEKKRHDTDGPTPLEESRLDKTLEDEIAGSKPRILRKAPPVPVKKAPTLKPSPLLRKAPPVPVNKAIKRPPLEIRTFRKAPPTLKPSPLLRKAPPVPKTGLQALEPPTIRTKKLSTRPIRKALPVRSLPTPINRPPVTAQREENARPANRPDVRGPNDRPDTELQKQTEEIRITRKSPGEWTYSTFDPRPETLNQWGHVKLLVTNHTADPKINQVDKRNLRKILARLLKMLEE